MNLLRIISIIALVSIIAIFFGTAEIFKEEIERDLDKANLENPFLPFAGLFLFGIPPAVAGLASSFCKSNKTKVIVSSGIIGTSYIVIFVIAMLMLDYPSMFGIPEGYWDTEE